MISILTFIVGVSIFGFAIAIAQLGLALGIMVTACVLSAIIIVILFAINLVGRLCRRAIGAFG